MYVAVCVFDVADTHDVHFVDSHVCTLPAGQLLTSGFIFSVSPSTKKGELLKRHHQERGLHCKLIHILFNQV